MSSSALPAVEAAAAPPPPMMHLSPVVSVIDPASPLPSSGSPSLVVLAAWMAAHEAHIAKYVREHHRLFPTSRILIVRCPLSNIIMASQRRKQLAPAVTVIREAVEAASTYGDEPRIFFHVFSNGGVSMVITLADMLKSQHGADFPRHVMILDSCPGYFHFGRAHQAIAVGLPRIASPLVALVLAVAWLVTVPFGIPPAPTENARLLNEPPILRRATRRAYLYGDADDMVTRADVEDHADKAAAATDIPILKELFLGGKHVSHVRIDPERYWRLVSELWSAK